MEKMNKMNKMNPYCIKFKRITDNNTSIRLKHYKNGFNSSNCADCGFKKLKAINSKELSF